MKGDGMRNLSLIFTVLAILMMALPSLSQECEYMPMTDGATLAYRDPTETYSPVVHNISGPIDYRGYEAYVVTWNMPQIVPPDGEQKSPDFYAFDRLYFHATDDGDLLLIGRKYHQTSCTHWDCCWSDSETWYDPPVVWIDAPLSFGRTWMTETTARKIVDSGCSSNNHEGSASASEDTTVNTVVFEFLVAEEGYITVPAGVYFGYGIMAVGTGEIQRRVGQGIGEVFKVGLGWDNGYVGNLNLELVSVSGLSGVSGDLPLKPTLTNYPNPFNPRTTISFVLPEPAAVRLTVFDMSGRLVRQLVNGEAFGEGAWAEDWDGVNQYGQHVASGTYFYRLEAGDFTETKRMVLIK
jgi:hypothetical protein